MTEVPRPLLAVLIRPSRVDEMTVELQRPPTDEELIIEFGVARHELSDRLAKAIESLPEVEQRVIPLLYFEKRTHSEAAEELGVTITRVERAEVMGVLRLRHWLKPNDA